MLWVRQAEELRILFLGWGEKGSTAGEKREVTIKPVRHQEAGHLLEMAQTMRNSQWQD